MRPQSAPLKPSFTTLKPSCNMQAAQDTVRDITSDEQPETEPARLKRMEGLKPEVNSLVHVALPEDMTIRDAEVLSSLILDILCQPRHYAYPPPERVLPMVATEREIVDLIIDASEEWGDALQKCDDPEGPSRSKSNQILAEIIRKRIAPLMSNAQGIVAASRSDGPTKEDGTREKPGGHSDDHAPQP